MMCPTEKIITTHGTVINMSIPNASLALPPSPASYTAPYIKGAGRKPSKLYETFAIELAQVF